MELSKKKQSLYLSDYFKALGNEWAADNIAYALLKANPSEFSFLPRPTKWMNRVKLNPYLLQKAALILSLLWKFGGAILFCCLEGLRCMYQHNKYLKKAPTLDNPLVLCFSSRAVDVIYPLMESNKDLTWLVFPWVPVSSLVNPDKKVQAFSLINYSDCYKALVLSIKANLRLAFKKKYKGWSLQGYTAFKWFITLLILEKIEGECYMAEHYDRWAVLADRWAGRKGSKQGTLHLVQHGQVHALQANQTPLVLYYQLKYLSSLAVYDELSADIFFDKFLSPKLKRSDLLVSYFKPMLLLTPLNLESAQGKSCLFVGHPICEAFHLGLYAKLQSLNIQCYYKPHPTMPASKPIKQQNWNLITDSQCFPRVDFLISYPSTLVTEYEHAGIPAFVHPVSVELGEKDGFLEQIEVFCSFKVSCD